MGDHNTSATPCNVSRRSIQPNALSGVTRPERAVVFVRNKNVVWIVRLSGVNGIALVPGRPPCEQPCWKPLC